jgi:predicted metal-dependent hydrolase
MSKGTDGAAGALPDREAQLATVVLRERTLRAIQEGLELFNAGRFWEAHEAWEAAWLVEDGDVRQMLQGLIQVAAGYLKALVQRRPRAAAKLLASGLAKLEPIPDSLAALRLEPLRRAVANGIDAARAWERGERDDIDPASVPRIERQG